MRGDWSSGTWDLGLDRTGQGPFRHFHLWGIFLDWDRKSRATTQPSPHIVIIFYHYPLALFLLRNLEYTQ